jgi:hypothetical protein
MLAMEQNDEQTVHGPILAGRGMRMFERSGFVGAVLALCLASGSAWAADDLCAERPGQTTPPCITGGGNILVETALADWATVRGSGDHSDTFLFADTLVRIGLGGSNELQLGWTPLGTERERDGTVSHRTRTGDISVAMKKGLSGDDGPVAITVRATVPVGRAPIGDGDWSAALLVPAELPLTDQLKLGLTPEIEAAVDEDGHGRHAAFGGAAGVSFDVSERVTVSGDVSAFRDQDPAGHTTMSSAGGSLAWQPSRRFQIDAGINVGLTRASPDTELYFGIVRKL